MNHWSKVLFSVAGSPTSTMPMSSIFEGNSLQNKYMKEVLKEKFLTELIPSEKAFFLMKAKQVIEQRGYPPGEDLFYYCYFLTLRERMRSTGTEQGEGYARVLLVEGTKEIEEMIKIYEERLEKRKKTIPDAETLRFIQYLSE